MIQEYKWFKIQQGESIAEVQKIFTHIVTHFIGLGKKFDKEKLNISKSRDLSTMTTTALFGKLRDHEIEMRRLNEKEPSDKEVKNISLKTNTK